MKQVTKQPAVNQSPKKRYQKPVLEMIQIDTEISLVMTSGTGMPTEPGGGPSMAMKVLKRLF
jgi:hypothetical protein